MMLERGSGGEGLLVRAEPLEWAEEVSQRMVHVERTMDGALFLEAEPTWAGAINMVLVSKGVRVSELARSSRVTLFREVPFHALLLRASVNSLG